MGTCPVEYEKLLHREHISLGPKKPPRNSRNSRNSRNQRTPMVLLRNSWMSPVFTAWVGSMRLPLKMGFVLLIKTF